MQQWAHSFMNISSAILPLTLIQEEQLSVNGERMYAMFWQTASGKLAQEECLG